jgi:transketolase
MDSMTMEQDSTALARRIRSHALRMTHAAKASHIGGCFSMADIVAVLYGGVLRVDPSKPDWAERDRLVISKGHAAAILYAVLAERGFFPVEWLSTYSGDGSRLGGHVTGHGVPGVELSSGSLGHGLSVACGMSLALRADKKAARVFALLSDGECDEGSIWEAALFAGHHKLDNLTAIVDYNKIQSFGSVAEILNLEPFADKWKAARWAVTEIDGHDHAALCQQLKTAETGKPKLIIAHTVKGKGVSFMENQLAWHYKSANDEQLAKALDEINGAAS